MHFRLFLAERQAAPQVQTLCRGVPADREAVEEGLYLFEGAMLIQRVMRCFLDEIGHFRSRRGCKQLPAQLGGTMLSRSPCSTRSGAFMS